MSSFDLAGATGRLGSLVKGLSDEELGRPTPCTRWSVADLVDHIEGLSLGFTAAARKDGGPVTATPPEPDGSRLGAGWRERVPARLDQLADAWLHPGAWQGMTRVGGVDLPGAVAAVVALDELVLHGWDLARATGVAFEPSPVEVEQCLGFVSSVVDPSTPSPREDLFGPPVPVADDATSFVRLVSFAGRDPAWRPGG